MGERKLPVRRKRASKGRAIRVSDLVYETLARRRKGSWDGFLRQMLGLPDRNGRKQPLLEGVLELSTGAFFLKAPGQTWGDLETDATEIAIRSAAKRKQKQIMRPTRMRELL